MQKDKFVLKIIKKIKKLYKSLLTIRANEITKNVWGSLEIILKEFNHVKDSFATNSLKNWRL